MSSNPLEVFWIFLRLGFTSFGGPIAHLGYFHDEFVTRRQWLNNQEYADLVALCQFLPGPASSQVGMAIGRKKAGVRGAIAAWIGFTLPSAIIMVLFGVGIIRYSPDLNASWLHSLKVVAVAVVAQAIWTMALKLCPDKQRIAIAATTCAAVSIAPSSWTQILTMVCAGLLGIYFLEDKVEIPSAPEERPFSKKTGVVSLVFFFSLLCALPVMAIITQNQGIKFADSFYRAGSLVFGGGHVVLPLLQGEVVHSGWVSEDLFMAGYGAAQAVPGPLFTFAAYLGAVSKVPPSGWMGAFICLCSIFLPAFLLIMGVLPFWEDLRHFLKIRKAMLGVNAAVVGLLLAAFYHPVWTTGILNIKDFVLALVAFIFLTFLKSPSWAVVIACAVGGGFFL